MEAGRPRAAALLPLRARRRARRRDRPRAAEGAPAAARRRASTGSCPAFREELVTALIRSLPKDAAPPARAGARRRRRGAGRAEAAQGPLRRPGRRASSGALRGVRVTRADFDHARLPAHLRMTFRVEDERGEVVAEGTDLDALRERGAAAPARGAGARGARPRAPRADARGRSASCRKVVALPGTGQAVRGYPALVDEGESVGVRVLETPGRAGRGDGGRHAPAAAARHPVAGARRAGGADATRSGSRSRPRRTTSVGAVLEDATTAALDALIAEAGGPAWDAAGVRAAARPRRRAAAGDDGRGRGARWRAILDAARDVERRARDALGAGLRARPPRRRAPSSRGSCSAGFVDRAPARRGCPTSSATCRAPRAASSACPTPPPSTATACARSHELEQAYRARLDAWPRGRALPAALREVPWMLEELRVSQFAQGLGTHGPVSAKRIRRALERRRLKRALLGREGCAGAAARASRRPPTAWARVRWLQPAGIQRRHRRRPPVVPILLLIAVLAGAAGTGYVLLARQAAADRRQEAVERFATAWEKRRLPRHVAADLARSAAATGRSRSSPSSYRIAAEEATVKSVRCARARSPSTGRRRCACACARATSGELRGTVPLRVVERDGEPYLDWSPSWRLPGLRDGENVRRTRARAPRAAPDPRRRRQPARRASRRRPRSSARAPAGGEPGSGLQALYDERLGGRPGAELRFGKRRDRARRGQARPRAAHDDLAAACSAPPTQALGDRLGGVAVMRPRDGARARARRASPSPARSRPARRSRSSRSPRALQDGIASPSSGYPVQHRARRSRASSCATRATSRAAARSRNSFAHSCNSVFAPLGAKLGAQAAASPRAEALRLQRDSRACPAAKPSTIPRDLKDDLAVGAAAIGQERDLATPLQMAAVGATIANRGVRDAPADRALRARRAPARRSRARSPRQVRDMMLGVVRGGTGTAAALPGVDVAGKTGTAELRPTGGGADRPEEHRRLVRRVRARLRPEGRGRRDARRRGPGRRDRRPVAREVLAAAL